MAIKNPKIFVKFIGCVILTISVTLYFFGVKDLLRHDKIHKIKRLLSEFTLSKDDQLAGRWGDFYRQISWIKDITPQDSLIIIPPEITITRGGQIALVTNLSHKWLSEYFMFPRLAAHEGDPLIRSHEGPVYRVRMGGFHYQGEYLQEDRFDPHLSLLLLRERLKETKPPPALTDFTEIEFNPLRFLAALFKLFLIVLSGTYFVSRYFGERSWLGFISASFLTGTVLSAAICILAGFAGVKFTETFQYGSLFLLSLPGFFSIKKWSFDHLPHWGGTLIVLIFFGVLFLKNILSPIAGWDACAVYGAKAKAIFALHNLDGLRAWGAVPHYPPLLSILMAQMAMGGEGAVNILFPLFSLCLYAILHDEITDTRFPSFLKMLLPLLIFTSPVFFYFSLLGYPNLALAVFVTKALIIVSRTIKRGTSEGWFAAALILSGAVLLRPDGIYYWLSMSILGWMGVVGKKGEWRYLLYLLTPLFCILLWKIYCHFRMHIEEDVLVKYSAMAFEHLANTLSITNLKMFFVLLFKFTLLPSLWWGVVPTLFAILFLFRRREILKKHPAECAFLATAFVGISVFSFFISPAWGMEFLFETGFTRYAMVLIPTMLIVLLKEIDRISTESVFYPLKIRAS